MNIGKHIRICYMNSFYLLMNVYGIRNIVANRRKKKRRKMV